MPRLGGCGPTLCYELNTNNQSSYYSTVYSHTTQSFQLHPSRNSKGFHQKVLTCLEITGKVQRNRRVVLSLRVGSLHAARPEGRNIRAARLSDDYISLFFCMICFDVFSIQYSTELVL